MKYRVFTYGIPAEEELNELNSFLSSQRILAVQHQIVVKDNVPYLMFVVEYLDTGKEKDFSDRMPKVDYKETLSEEDFTVFSDLRDLRKEISDKDKIPVYQVFTNAQLAEMVEKRINTLAGLKEIDGVGKARIEKYGERFLKRLSHLLKESHGGSL